MNLFLFALFMIIMLGTFFSSKRLSGEGNLPASFATAGFITAGASFIMYLIPGLLPSITVVVTFSISIVGVIWLFFTNRDNK